MLAGHRFWTSALMWEKQLKRRKDLFWLTVSEVSVHVTWFHCFWAQGVAEDRGLGECGGRGCSPHSSQEAEWKRKCLATRFILQRVPLSPTSFSSELITGLTHWWKVVPSWANHLAEVPLARDHAFSPWNFGDCHIQTLHRWTQIFYLRGQG
jgi:hypothetical protein